MKTCTLLAAAIIAFFLAGRVTAQNLTPLKPGDPVVIELKAPSDDSQVASLKINLSAAGTIKVTHLDREISAVGLTTSELARRIEQAYKAAEIYTNPTIVVNTQTPEDQVAHIVTVGGEVKSGGREVPLRNNMRLYQAIMAAGGLTEFADPKRVRLMRGNRSQVFDIRKIQDNGSNNPILMDGDTIHIPQ